MTAHPLGIDHTTSDPPETSAPKVCSFQLPEVCSFRLPLTVAAGDGDRFLTGCRQPPVASGDKAGAAGTGA